MKNNTKANTPALSNEVNSISPNMDWAGIVVKKDTGNTKVKKKR